MKKKLEYIERKYAGKNGLPYWKYLYDIENDKNVYAESNVFNEIAFFI